MNALRSAGTYENILFIRNCQCAGSGCGGHVMAVTLTGYQGAAQHTFTTACDGYHPSGPCPPSREVPS